MLRWQRISTIHFPMLVACGVWATLVGAPAFTGATDPAPEKSKPATAAEDQSPEQAAGGFANFMRLRKACETDGKRFCKDVKLGGGRILQCLREHEPELAPGCRQALGAGSSKP
ncbi:MAG: cysteine rich repeat-containing protein [Nitrospira sp.]